jgi:hypothetical protein
MHEREQAKISTQSRIPTASHASSAGVRPRSSVLLMVLSVLFVPACEKKLTTE